MISAIISRRARHLVAPRAAADRPGGRLRRILAKVSAAVTAAHSASVPF